MLWCEQYFLTIIFLLKISVFSYDLIVATCEELNGSPNRKVDKRTHRGINDKEEVGREFLLANKLVLMGIYCLNRYCVARGCAKWNRAPDTICIVQSALHISK